MNLYKHLSVITKSKTTVSRPILQHFHYSKEMQSVSACDSHRLLEFKNMETIEKTANIHYQTMQMADENIQYPDLQRLKPSNADIVAKIDVKAFNSSLLQLLKVYKKEVIKLSFNGKSLTIETDQQMITTLPLLENVENCYLYMNCTYFIDLIAFFIDYIKEVNCESLIAGFCGTNRPIFFETENRQFFYLITPIRKNKYNFILETISLSYRFCGLNYKTKRKKGFKMKTNIRIYDRMDSDIPYHSTIYIVDTHEGYTVFTNVYNVTFCEKFKTKEEALEYYNRKKVTK